MFFSQKIFTGKKMGKGGFTIIELMVSIALFTATFIAISSSFISIVDAYRKIMAERVNVDNLSTAVESMVRGLKTGTNFHCGSGGDIQVPQACPGGSTYLAFEMAKGNPNVDTDQIVYKFVACPNADPLCGRLQRSDEGDYAGKFYPVTDVTSVITISNLLFYVVGSVGLTDGDTVQPKAVIVMSGTVGTGVKKSSTFSIQTTITQRLLDDGSGAVAGASDSTPPSDPIGFSATTFSSSQINLMWTASSDPESGVSGYRVERCQGSGCSSFSQINSLSSTSFSDTGLLPSMSYSYRVRAVNGDGLTSGYSATASATTPASSDTTPPSNPSGLSATAISSSQINLTWTASSDPESGVSGYRVERCLTSSCTYAQIGTTAGATSYSDSSGLSPSTQYSYRVRAENSISLLSGYSATASATTPAAGGGNIAPSGTAYRWSNNTTATANTNRVAASGLNDGLSTDVDLSGIGGDGSGRYEAGGVIWSSSQTVSSVKFTNGTYTADGVFGANLTLQITTDGTTWINSGLTAVPTYPYDSSSAEGVTYTFTGTPTSLRGVRVSGQVSVYLSQYANMREVQVFGAASDTTAPSTPGTPVASAITSSSFTLNWTASSDAVGVTGYTINRCSGVSCTPTYYTTTGSNTYSESGLTPATTYRYNVSAYDAAGNDSANSGTGSATTATAGADITSGLVAYWKFDESSGTMANDSSVGGTNDGTYVGTPTLDASPKIGNARAFNGTTQYVTTPLINTGTTFTYSAWVKPNSQVALWGVLLTDPPGNNGIYHLSTGELVYYNGVTQTSTGSLINGVWSHVVVVVSGGSGTFYINNTTRGTITGVTSIPAERMAWDSIAYDEWFKGSLDDVRIYNRALTVAQINALYAFTGP